jgi:hypothetical protein
MSMLVGNSGAQFCAGQGLSAAVFGCRAILATGVRRGSRGIQSRVRVSPTALCGRGAETSGDDLPVVAVQAGSWQVQHERRVECWPWDRVKIDASE